MYGDGIPASAIIQTLNAEGRKTSVGNKFTINSLHSILKNERYTGVYIWGDVRIEDGIPAIITKEEYDRVQRKIKKRAQAPASSRSQDDYILTGKLFCGYCGKPMVGESGVGKSGQKYCYYKCIGQKRGSGCKKKPVRKDALENYIIANTREKCLSDSAISLIVDAALKLQEEDQKSGNLVAYQKELSDTERSIKNIVSAIEQGIITPSTKHRLGELEDQKSELEILIAKEQIQKPKLTGQQLRFWMERFRKGSPTDPAYRKTFVDMFITAVYVYDDYLKIIVCYNNNSTEIIANLVSDPDAKPHSEFGFDGNWTAIKKPLLSDKAREVFSVITNITFSDWS
ncbi:MAG: recombinase family protein, partial [Eubacteriales bacterium]